MQFFERDFHEYERAVVHRLQQKISAMSDAEIEDDGVFEQLKDEYRLKGAEIDWDSLVALTNHREERQYVRDSHFGPQEVTEVIYSFEVPYKGDRILFTLRPSTRRLWSFEAKVDEQAITFEIVGADKARLQRIRDNLSHDIGNLSTEVSGYNSSVEQILVSARERRREQLAQNQRGLDVFGVPIKQEG